MEYIATFFTHFGAVSFRRRLEKMGDSPVMQPVPRALSSSCGSCVRFQTPFDADAMTDEDVEGVYLAHAGGYQCLYQSRE